ncbi:MAG: nicotinamide-nucleotide amidohydrolase family protein [Xanthomonadales bacterium]
MAQLSAALLARRWTMAAAESCTGGWIAKVCTDRAGSSDWFERGFVTYSNAAKRELLGVDGATLDRAGAVSEAVARGMAEGALGNSPADVAVAVTGIAGPAGGVPGKPVGTVWFGWAIAGGGTWVERCRFDGDREAVRRQTVRHALQGLLDRL